jgi:hypothetical protein
MRNFQVVDDRNLVTHAAVGKSSIHHHCVLQEKYHFKLSAFLKGNEFNQPQESDPRFQVFFSMNAHRKNPFFSCNKKTPKILFQPHEALLYKTTCLLKEKEWERRKMKLRSGKKLAANSWMLR